MQHPDEQEDAQGKFEIMEREKLLRASRDLIDQLQVIQNPTDVRISCGESSFTVAQLIEDIRKLTPRGLKHVKLWLNAQKTLRKLGKVPLDQR